MWQRVARASPCDDRVMSPIGVLRLDGVPAARLAAMSRTALDRTLRHPAELVLATLSDEAVVLGALQRASELTE